MAEDIFKFWSQMPKGERIHPADKEVFQRIHPKRHGFRLECLPGNFSGPLKKAPVVLLYLSPGFSKPDLRDATDEEGQDYHTGNLRGTCRIAMGRTSRAQNGLSAEPKGLANGKMFVRKWRFSTSVPITQRTSTITPFLPPSHPVEFVWTGHKECCFARPRREGAL
jgi:hypothetical protein